MHWDAGLGERKRVFQLGNWMDVHTIHQDRDSRNRKEFVRTNHDLSMDILRWRYVSLVGHSGQQIDKLLGTSA